LHDASLVGVRSDLLARTLVLEFEIHYLQDFHKLPDGLRFQLRFEGIQSVRVLRYSVWPGAFSVPPGVSRAEESRLVKEYWAKWREESVGWSDFEAAFSADADTSLEVSDATLVESQAGTTAFWLAGHLDDKHYHQVYVRAERVDALRSDNEPLGMALFKTMGEQYWEAFAQRRRDHS
jgi:hypothetical protein